MNSNRDFDCYDSAVISSGEYECAEVQMRVQAVKQSGLVSLEALRAVVSHEDATKVIEMQAILELAEQRRYAQC